MKERKIKMLKKRKKMISVIAILVGLLAVFLFTRKKKIDADGNGVDDSLDEVSSAVVSSIAEEYPEEKKLAAQCVTAWNMSPGGNGGPPKWRNFSDSDKVAKSAISQVFNKNLNSKAFREAFDTMATGTFADAVIKHLSNGERKRLSTEIAYCLA